jgi:glycosyltransferase involved in cell wall biosynthesis
MGGGGGLAVQSANALAGLARGRRPVTAIGPGISGGWPMAGGPPVASFWDTPAPLPGWLARYSPLRWSAGELQLLRDRQLGCAAAAAVERLDPEVCYAFTQVGLETLRWAAGRGVPAVLETPNGHLRNFREVYAGETARWCRGRFRGHPTPAMVARVEEEYALATRIRVSSRWTRDSLVAAGVAAAKISVLEQAVDLDRFSPPASRPPADGPLRLCFVGSLDLRKGFVHLLRALRAAGPERFALTIVGATGDRCSRRLFAAESAGLPVTAAPGDPVPVYRRSELMVLPTLEDGSPFAAAEAMASGLPLVVTASCGAAEWVRPGEPRSAPKTLRTRGRRLRSAPVP